MRKQGRKKRGGMERNERRGGNRKTNGERKERWKQRRKERRGGNKEEKREERRKPECVSTKPFSSEVFWS